MKRESIATKLPLASCGSNCAPMCPREKEERKREDGAEVKRGGPERRPFPAAVALAVSGAKPLSSPDEDEDEEEEEEEEEEEPIICSLLLLSLSCLMSSPTSMRMSSAAANGWRQSGHGAVFSRGTNT